MRHAACLILLGPILLNAQPYLELIRKPILPEDTRRSMMYSYVDRNLPPITLPETRAAWESRKPQLRKEILQSVGLEDIDRRKLPP